MKKFDMEKLSKKFVEILETKVNDHFSDGTKVKLSYHRYGGDPNLFTKESNSCVEVFIPSSRLKAHIFNRKTPIFTENKNYNEDVCALVKNNDSYTQDVLIFRKFGDVNPTTIDSIVKEILPTLFDDTSVKVKTIERNLVGRWKITF